ncbi:Uncharacterised protein [uncultured archaeon]|nr:Uncharacterised protein [uncultured archaeon]
MPGEGAIASMFISLGVSNQASSVLNQVNEDMNTTQATGKSLADKIGILSGKFGEMGHFVDRAMNMMDRYEISQLNVDNAVNRLQNSQARYNEVVTKFGEHSAQAVSAARDLEVAQNNLERANIRSTSSMVLIGVSAVSMIPQVMSFGKAIVDFAKTGTLAIGGLTLTMSTLAPWLVVIGAGLGALYYWHQKNTESAYNLRTEQDALSSSLANTTASMFPLTAAIDPLTAAEGELATKQVQMKQALKEWIDAVKEFGPDSPEAKAAKAKYEELARVVSELEQKLKDLKTATEGANISMGDSSVGVRDWKDAFSEALGFVGTAAWGAVASIGTAFDNLMQGLYTIASNPWNGQEADIQAGIESPYISAFNNIINAYNILKNLTPLTSWLPEASPISGYNQSSYGGTLHAISPTSSEFASLEGDANAISAGIASGDLPSQGYYGSGDQNIEVQTFASGGEVKGIGTGDTVPARLTPGEFVVPKGGRVGNRISVNMHFNAPIYGVDDLDAALQRALDRLNWNIKSLGG